MIKWGIIWSFVSLAAMAGLTLFAWQALPDDAQIAVHWSASGEINRYAGKVRALLGLPALGVGLTLLFAFLPKIAPRRKHLEQSSGLYISGWIGAMAILACAHAFIVFTALSDGEPQFAWIMVPISLLLIVVGNYMTKSRSNWFAGIKTPWTLSSEYSWAVTHRFGGYGFVLIGALSLFAIPFFEPSLVLMGTTVSLLAVALASVIISIIAWRNDPERQSLTESN